MNLPLDGHQEYELPQVIEQKIWATRKLCLSIATTILVVVGYKFEDYELINNKLLEDIKIQNLELKRSIENFLDVSLTFPRERKQEG